jgi:hypothetical protein
MAGRSGEARMDPSNSPTGRKERTMDTDIRRMQVDFRQQQLRDESAAYRLARGGHDREASGDPTARIPRTIGALRRLVGTATA